MTRYLVPLTGLFLASCQMSGTSGSQSRYLAAYGPRQDQRAKTDPGAAMPDDTSYWAGDGKSGSPLIRINRAQQKAYFYKGGELVGMSRISTGKEGHNTPPGTYKITEKDRDHRSNLYGIFEEIGTARVVNDDADMSKDKVPAGCKFVGAPMWNFMRFTGGIGMHTGYLPGYNASHGCVRMPDKMARAFFDNVQLGTPVVVE
ncbi:lipoprotein-anchoring transpeptidase ErfK/SrfK [Haloferula luteola]|uniref:Lipoprotein-anchoring transpeptidase ErfK/SrfK n=1 Tax=Haloferula luteola TaxID=595692 RepID=A0A840V734_9BACT|nr:L,D-transpeptidase family protein [Haloferula luteola]MBB5350558.1 lipoprotein-anchoring transpeptidase ErfK/SrfK [Haloferula luteola]